MRAYMRVSAIAGVLALLPVAGWTQQKAESPTKITSTTELVLVPAVVTDKGNHVPKMTKDDFTILENGKEQKIAIFEEVQPGTERIEKPNVTPGEFANLDVSQARRITIIAIDMINTPTLALANVRDELVTFLSDPSIADETLGIVALLPNGIRVLHDITTDKKAIALALQMYKSPSSLQDASLGALGERGPEAIFNPSSEQEAQSFAIALRAWGAMKDSEQQVMQAQRRASRLNTLEALQELAQMLSGIPGRKSVIWASASFPFGDVFSTSGGLAMKYTPGGNDLTHFDYITYTWRLLNAANIAIYPVDARGLVNTAYEAITPDKKNSPTYAEKEMVRSDFNETISTFENIAAATGGKPCYGRTDLHNCFKEATNDSHAYYVLGYYVDRTKNPIPGWRKLEVKVAAKGAKVRARNGYFLAPQVQNAEAVRKADISMALAAPISYSGLFFSGKWNETTSKGTKKAVGYELTFPARSINVDEADGNHVNLDVVAIATDRTGKAAANNSQKIDRRLPSEALPQIRSGGIRYHNAMDLEPGTYLVHFVVRDNIGEHTGSIVIPLKVD